MKVNCPHCSQPLEVPAELAGQTIPCPSCEGLLSLPAPAVVTEASSARAGLPVGWVIGLTALIVGLAATVIGLLVVRKSNGPSSAVPATAGANAAVRPDDGVTGWVVPTLPKADAQGWVTLFDGERLYGVNPTNINIASGKVAMKGGLLAADGTGGWNGGIQFNWIGHTVGPPAGTKERGDRADAGPATGLFRAFHVAAGVRAGCRLPEPLWPGRSPGTGAHGAWAHGRRPAHHHRTGRHEIPGVPWMTRTPTTMIPAAFHPNHS